MKLQNGRPADTTGRLEKELRCYDLLDRLGVPYERVDHAPAMTMEVCQEIDRDAERGDLQKPVSLQPAGDRVLPADDPRHEGVPHQGSVGADRLGAAVLR